MFANDPICSSPKASFPLPTIHPTALVSPNAKLGSDVTVGPFSIIEDDVVIGDGCQIASQVTIKNGTTLGVKNVVGESVVLGGTPQHAQATGPFGRLVIGDENKFREFVTVHVSMSPDAQTTMGNGNYLMINAHIGHDSHIGNHTILANAVMISGHVTIEDYAFLSGNVGIHQFCRVGQNAMVGGMARMTQDIPPYVTIDGASDKVVGLNTIGLRRRGFNRDHIKQLKEAYRVIYRSGLPFSEVLEKLQADFPKGPAAKFYEFMSAGGKRGFVQERRAPRNATVKFRVHNDDATDEGDKKREAV